VPPMQHLQTTLESACKPRAHQRRKLVQEAFGSAEKASVAAEAAKTRIVRLRKGSVRYWQAVAELERLKSKQTTEVIRGAILMAF